MHIALAGGTSPTLGRSITTALLSAGHSVTILSRMPSANTTTTTSSSGDNNSTENAKSTPTTAHNAPILYVDYKSPTSLTTLFQSLAPPLTAVISILKITDPTLNTNTHLHLLSAALSTPSCTRFIPSNWSLYPLSHASVPELAGHGALLRSCRQHLQKNPPTDGRAFEIASFHTGGFLEYFVQGTPSPDRDRLTHGLDDPMMKRYIDVGNGVLRVPTTPTTGHAAATIGMTSLQDIGRAVVEALTVPAGAWPEDGVVRVVGWKGTFEEVRAMLEGLGVKLKEGEGEEGVELTVGECETHVREAEPRLADAEREGKGLFDYEAFIQAMVGRMMGVLCRGERDGGWAEDWLEGIGRRGERVDLREVLREAWC